MTVFPAGFSAAADLDADDSLLVSVDGVTQKATPALVRGYVDASHYPDLDQIVLNPCESITGFVTSLGSQLPPDGDWQLDPTIKTTGSNSVRVKAYLSRSPTPSSTYWNLPAPQAVGNYVEVAFDLRSSSLDVGSTLLKAFVASGLDKTGTVVYADDFTYQFPNDQDHNDTWYTIRVPITGLTSIQSIGITQTGTVQSAAIPFIWFDNIVMREATGFDQAVYRSPANTHIVIPNTYTTTKAQYPVFREPAGITWEDRRPATAHTRFSGTGISLADYMLDPTGVIDSSTPIQKIILDATPGSTIRGVPGSTYRLDNRIVFTNNDVIFDMTGCTMMSKLNVDADQVTLYACNNITLKGGLWLGYGPIVNNGSTMLTVAGTPTTNGTAKELNALDEEVKLTNHTNWGIASIFSRHLPQQLGLPPDELGPRCYFEFSMFDTNQVANDCVIRIYDDIAGTLLSTFTFTLTASPATYRVYYVPRERLMHLRVQVKKATATANTITINSYTPYGENEYNPAFDSAACVGLEGAYYSKILDMDIEGFGGDAVQVSNENVHHLLVSGVKSYLCRRQGMSFNQGTDMVIENCEIYGTGRSGIDFEPYTATWYTQRVTVRNIYMDEITNFGFAMVNWARNYDFTIENIVIAKSRFGVISGGFQRGYIRNAICRYGISTYDYDLMGANMVVENCRSIVGIRCNDDPSDSDIGDGNGVITYTPINNVIRNCTFMSGLVNRRQVHVEPGGGYRFQNMVVSEAVQPTFVAASTGQIGFHTTGEWSGINWGEIRRQLPGTYKGIGHHDVWVPDGFNSHDDPIHQVRGLSGSTTRSNNLRGVAAAVSAGATSLAVTFPTRNVGSLTAASTAATNATAGSLTPATTYYYRIAPRERYCGPATYLAQFQGTTGASATAMQVVIAGTLDTANGKYINAVTLLRGTTNGGPYTHRYDIVPTGSTLARLHATGVTVVDLGPTCTTNAESLLGPYTASVGSWTGTVNETGYEPDTSYAVMIEANWATQTWITNKTTAGFTVNFGSAAPGDGSGRISWFLVR